MKKFADRLYLSTASIQNNRNLPAVLETYLAQGILRVELSALHNYMSIQELSDLIVRFQRRGMDFIFHNYFPRPPEDFVLNACSADPQVQEKTRSLIGSAVELGTRTGVDLYCFHAGYLVDPVARPDGMFDFPSQDALLKRSAAVDIFSRVFEPLVKKWTGRGFFLGLENLFPPSAGPNTSTFCSFEDIRDVMEISWVRNSDLGLLIDLGHLKIASKVLGFDADSFLDRVIVAYGDRIYEVHLSENNGLEDDHLAICEGSWQLASLARFRSTGMLCGQPTRVCLESRKLTVEQVKDNFQLIRGYMEDLH